MFKKYFIPIILMILACIGFVKINIVNTKSLSPLGNADDNFSLVSETFGEDFEEFIKDKSVIKIYPSEEEQGDELATVKISDKEINLTKRNIFLNALEPFFSFIKKGTYNVKEKFNDIKDKFNKDTENNDIKNNIEQEGNELDKKIDDFIKTLDGN